MNKIVFILGSLLLPFSIYAASLAVMVTNNLPQKQTLSCKTDASNTTYTIAGQKAKTIKIDASKFTLWIYPSKQSTNPCRFVVSVERGGILLLGTWGVIPKSYGYCLNSSFCSIPNINTCTTFKVKNTPQVVNENGQQILRITVDPANN